MRWQIVTRVGSNDTYDPVIDASAPRLLVAIDQPGNRKNVCSQLLQDLSDDIGSPIPNIARDLMNMATTVFTADVRVSRELTKDRWMREFDIHLPVADIDTWNKARGHIARTLRFLTGDDWNIIVREVSDIPEVRPNQSKFLMPPDMVALFSGGLDSFVGAVDRLAEGKRLALVGHYGSGKTHPAQTNARGILEKHYRGKTTEHFFHLQPPRQNGDEGEPTMRSRSLLFLGLGVAVSAAYGNDIPLQMAENGFISLNVPLTNSRIGSASTRTTHPHFIKLFRRLLALLGISVRINLPYRFVTKGEMLDQTLDPLTLAEGLPGTMSCSHPESGRFRGGVKPCGYCVPCIIRLASVHAASLNDEPPLVDILTNPPAANSNMGSDFRAFQMAIARTAHENNREAGLRVLESGPLSSDEVPDFSALYLRGLKEVERFLNSG